MKKRINPALITPAYEDSGLFKKPPTELVVSLIPKFGTNSRQDILIKGLMKNNVEIDVIFAGRRKYQAVELVNLLKRKWAAACARVPNGGLHPPRRDVRVPTRVQGAWRMRVFEEEEEQNLVSKEYQLIAARWGYKSETGESVSFGEPPVVEKKTKYVGNAD